MDDFKAHIAEDRRLVILRLLHGVTNNTLNDRLIQSGLSQYGHGTTGDTVRADLAQLQDLGAVKLEKLPPDIFVATLTRRGAEHVERLTEIPGIKRPGLGA
jgi:hypothetical protein